MHNDGAMGNWQDRGGRMESWWAMTAATGCCFIRSHGRLMLVLHHPFDGRLSKAHLYEIEDTGDTVRVKKEVAY